MNYLVIYIYLLVSSSCKPSTNNLLGQTLLQYENDTNWGVWQVVGIF